MDHSDRLILRRDFVIVDSILVGFALVAALYSSDKLEASFQFSVLLTSGLTIPNLLRAAAIFSAWAILMRLFRTYTMHTIGAFSEAARIAAAVASTALLLYFSFGSNHKGASAFHICGNFCLFCFLSLYGIRAAVSFLTQYTGPALLGRRKVLIVGTGPRSIRTFRYVRTQMHRSHQVVGFVDCRDQSLCAGEIEAMYLGPLSQLESILIKEVVDEVIIALPARSCYAQIEEAVEIALTVGVKVKYPADMFPCPRKLQTSNELSHGPAMLVLGTVTHDARLLVKRLLDIVVSSMALLTLAPALLLVAALIKITSPGPVFFLQERYGLGRRRFLIYKFRTMVADAEQRMKSIESLNEAQGPIFKIRKDPRITKIGAFLRRTSIDELPQLFNVLLGHMSLVGPRPMSVRDVSLFNEAWLMRRFSVKPGITGLWQVNGRSTTTFDRWMELDLQYIDHWSLGLDAKILAWTIPTVVRGYGAM